MKEYDQEADTPKEAFLLDERVQLRRRVNVLPMVLAPSISLGTLKREN